MYIKSGVLLLLPLQSYTSVCVYCVYTELVYIHNIIMMIYRCDVTI